MKEILKMRGISKNFGSVKALSGVDFTLLEGEVHALMGENGAGKSTLMNILSGSIRSFEGDMEILGSPAHIKSPLHARQLGVAKIHQELQMVKELSVAENMFMGREIARHGVVNKKAQEREAQQYIDMLGIDIKASRPLKSLRIGEQQMVEIAKAISLNTRILIMDEPTSAISEAETKILFEVIRRLKREGVGIIYITHRMEEVFEIADRLTILRDGQYIKTLNTHETSHDEIISLMVGRELSDIAIKPDNPLGKEVLRVEGLSFYPQKDSFKRSISDISFAVRQGEVLGLAGLLGSGRSEVFEALFGMHPQRIEGKVFIDGQQVQIKHPRDAIRRGVSFVTEDRKGKGLVLLRSISENMTLPLLREYSRALVMQKSREAKDSQGQMDSLKIKAPDIKTQCQTLSGGNQQKVILARWLLTKPRILLLDEPTRGIDVGAKSEIYHLISQLAQSGMAILVISSELPELISICDRFVTLCEGRMTGVFEKEGITQEKLLYHATLRKEKTA